MSDSTSSSGTEVSASWGRGSTIFLSLVLTAAVVGYFVGIADGVPQVAGFSDESRNDLVAGNSGNGGRVTENESYPALAYSEIPTTFSNTRDSTRLVTNGGEQADLIGADMQFVAVQVYDPLPEIDPDPVAKAASGEIRATRRAFNGAPPIIPHDIADTSDSACYACHGKGLKLGELRASVMSHGFLANCTQCHVGPAATPLRGYEAEFESTFVGLPAPSAGKRAFPGAPPTIPHSTFMRENCAACHGDLNGWPGMESTHPWRTACSQCHAPSAALDQAIAADVPMLPALKVSSSP